MKYPEEGRKCKKAGSEMNWDGQFWISSFNTSSRSCSMTRMSHFHSLNFSSLFPSSQNLYFILFFFSTSLSFLPPFNLSPLSFRSLFVANYSAHVVHTVCFINSSFRSTTSGRSPTLLVSTKLQSKFIRSLLDWVTRILNLNIPQE